MDKNTLVDQDRLEGKRLIQDLDSAGFPVVAAFWYYLPDGGPWRLYIASPVVREQGPRAAYRRIQEVMADAGGYSMTLGEVSAVSPEESPVTELRIFAGTDGAPFIGGVHFLKTYVGDAWFEGAYLYRAERIVGMSDVLTMWCATPEKGHRIWKARKATVKYEDGFMKTVEVEGFFWPQSHSKTGVNIHLGVLGNLIMKEGRMVGDVQKWTVLGGRLRSVETVALGVPVEGLEGQAAVAAPA